MPDGTNISIDVESIKDIGGIYELNYSVMGQKAPPLYISLDGKYIYPQRIPVDFEVQGSSKPSPQNTAVPKSDKPKVELFVMSYCPYGTQMEKSIYPCNEITWKQSRYVRKIRKLCNAWR